jgi:N-formylglutamate deformylase
LYSTLRTAAASYPRAFLTASRLEVTALRRSEDSFVDELAFGVVERGYPLMRAHFPRCYVDVNREPYELDPRMFEGRLPSFANTRSMRVAGGLGTVARVVGDAQEIYGQRIRSTTRSGASRGCTSPTTARLRRLFTRVHRDFGAAVADRLLTPCPRRRLQGRAPARRRGPGRPLWHQLRRRGRGDGRITLRAQGYSVSRNKPYAGGFITEHYGNPAAGLHAIQLELNRALYMDERRFERSSSFARLAADLEALAIASPRFRCRSCGPIALPPNNSARQQSRAAQMRALGIPLSETSRARRTEKRAACAKQAAQV